jgi:hypothetical protein
MSAHHGEWQERSRRALVEAIDDLRARMQAKRSGTRPPPPAAEEPRDSALARVTRKFRLTAFERDVLLIAAGVEVDAQLAGLVADWHADSQRSRPTFALAAALCDQPHWSATAPDAVLRRGRLIRLGEGPGVADSPISIEEPVLHALNGLACLDEGLRPFVAEVHPGPLVPSRHCVAAQVAEAWRERRGEDGRAKVMLVTGDAAGAADVFAAACQPLGLLPCALDLVSVPADRAALQDLIDLWERDAVILDAALLIDGGAADTPERRAALAWCLERLAGFVAVVGDRVPSPRRGALVRLAIDEVSVSEQAAVWQRALGPLAATLDGHLGRVTEQFRLSPRAIEEAAAELRASGESAAGPLEQQAWEICRRQARGGLDELAQRLEPRADWDRLVLPDAQMRQLRSIATQVRHRFQVYERWGFRAQSSRGFGVSALFHGPSGTGKTYAAEALAHDLALDLYRVDLSATVSKYIGETEKNLRRIFDAAEQSGAILLFDEADALFGKRSEVNDSHDRYANLEVSYLLQRMEAYRGLAILTTNLKGALDQAFLRRIRFVVSFPFPGAAERERIWRNAFPPGVPLDARVEWAKLSRLAVAGGNIANIALDAAFRAADAGSGVTMTHLLAASQAECAKIEKPLTDSETRGWV